jgi:superfamily II DNA or RNA helicase
MVQLFKTQNTGDWPNTKIGKIVWYLTSDRNDNFTPIAKAKGFKFAGRRDEATGRWVGRLNWFTDDEIKAAEFCDYAITTEIGKELVAIKERGRKSIVLSRAETTTKILPCPDGEEYLGYQCVGIEYACDRKNTLIADDPGLGKTIQALGFINCNPDIKRVLIVCPNTLKLNWKREALKWLINPFSIGIADTQQVPINSDIVITNYDALKKESVNKVVASVKWDLLIIDEAHYYKNVKTIGYRSIVGGKYSKKKGEPSTKEYLPIISERKIFTTGTPIENFVSELWPLISILDPDRWNSRTFWSFHKTYCDVKSNGYGMDWKGANKEKLPELQELLRKTIMVRRLKPEVLKELPARRRSIVELEYDDQTSKNAVELGLRFDYCLDKFDSIEADAELAKAADDELKYKVAVEAMEDGLTIPFEEMAGYRIATGRAKIPYIIEYLESKLEEVGKIIVGCWHKEVVHVIANHWPDESMSIYGEMTTEERQASVDRFQTDPKCKLAILTRAGYEGITLTAASTVVVAEEPWKPSSLDQLESRAHRIGQTEAVNIIHLVFKDSIDIKMLKRIFKKQEITDIALNDDCQNIVTEDNVKRVVETTKKEMKAEVADITQEQAQNVLAALVYMCSGDTDFARAKNGIGFNKVDSRIGHSLAELGRLTFKQTALGMRVLRKYKKQIPEYMYSKIFEQKAAS